MKAGTPDAGEAEATRGRRLRRRLVLAAVAVPMAAVALFAARLVQGSDRPTLISESSSITVTATMTPAPDVGP